MTARALTAVKLPEFRVVRSECSWKVGLDLGSATTTLSEVVACAPGPASVSSAVLPTLMAYRDKGGLEAQVVIGEAAARMRDAIETFSPYAVPESHRSAALYDFASALRQLMGTSDSRRPWGVVASPSEADARRQSELRAVAGELFERFLMVDETLLLALGVLDNPSDHHGVVVDVGAKAVRAAVVRGHSLKIEHRSVLPHGGRTVDQLLKNLLIEKYPDLALTDHTALRLKEQLGFVAPATRQCKVKLTLGNTERVIDLTSILREACESLVPVIMRAIREVLAHCPFDVDASYLPKVFLAGGGSATMGLPQRILQELKREGFDRPVVNCVDDPQSQVAQGALKWALLTRDEEWGIPLFAYRPAV